MENIKSKVKDVLIRCPQTRDCNYKLYGNFLHFNYPETSVISLYDYIHSMIDSKYPKIETITRCSRQLQEKHLELRGIEWEDRQRQIKPVQKDLGYNV